MNKTGRLLSLLAGFLLAAVPLAAGDFASDLERYDALRVDAASTPVSGLSLTSGSLSVLLRSGHAARVQAGEEMVGLFFVGDGVLEYKSSDPVEHGIAAFNVKKNSGLRAEKGSAALTLRGDFQRLLWIAPGKASPLPAEKGGTGGDLSKPFRDHFERFRRGRGTPASHHLLLHRAAPGSSLVLAEIGGSDDLRYVREDFERRSESLSVLRKADVNISELRRYLWPVTLSDQPVGRDRRVAPIPQWMLTDVRLDLSASGGKDVELVVKETIIPLGRPQSALRFDLYNATYAFVGAGGLQPRLFRVESVRDGGGKPLPFHHASDELLVGLAKPAPPDQPVQLEFRISGDFLIRPGGDNYWLLGVEPWFPQPDFGGQYYTLETTVRVPRPFVPFAPGATKSRRVEGDLNVLETRVEKPVQFGVILAGKYAHQEETRRNVTVRVATYAMSNARAMRQLMDLTFGIIEYYENFLGPFPFPEFNIIEINEYGFGQAPPGIMFITKEAFNPYIGELNQLFSQGINERFAHEIAHQYWGHVVKMPSEEEQWITEAFAEYSAAVFLKAFKGESTYNRLVKHWGSRARYATGTAPIPLANRVSIPKDFISEFTIRTGLLYDKGAWLLAALHKELGDQMFLTFLKSYQKSFRWKFGSTQTVAGMLEYLTKKDYRPFFEANYWGTGMPAD